VSGLSV